MGQQQGFDRSAPWARIVLDGDAALRRAGTSARDKENELRAKGYRRVLQVLRGERGEDFSWGKGALGEEALGTTLGRLPDGWTCVHDRHIDGGDANVDHVVVGPPGIFTLNTKNLGANVWVASRTFMVGGQRQDYLWRSKAEARDVASVLERGLGYRPQVWPVIVVIAPKVTIKESPKDVTVIQARELVPWLTSLAATLDGPELEAIRRAVRHESTWDSRIAAPRVVDFVPAHQKGQAPQVPEFTFTPWRRYGKRRLYIKDENGNDLGFFDELSSEFHLVEGLPDEHLEGAIKKYVSS
jgi:hypothetical protein